MAKKVIVGSVNVPKYGRELDADKYTTMKKAILKVLPKFPLGLTQNEMRAAVAPLVPREAFADQGKVNWWCKVVQLDLEKAGEVKRDKKSTPLKWGRV